MKNNPLISLIVPVYNPGKHLIKCLDSLTNQTYPNLEILLVDDGSTDGSAEICDKYAAKDERIRCVHQKNAGVSSARNKGLSLATGDYIHFPDSDDYYEPDTYEYLLQQMNAAAADAICFDYFTTYPDREIPHAASDGFYGVCEPEKAIYELLFSNRSFLCTKLLPASAVKDIRFLENIYRDEDTIFCMFALHNVPKTVYVDRPLLHYVQSEQSATRGSFRLNQLSAVDAVPIVENFLTQHYPALLQKWRVTYLELFIMLYGDMYFDSKEYPDQMKSLYRSFCELYRKTAGSAIGSTKQKVKIQLFRFSPKFFCKVHGIIHHKGV